MSEFHKEQDHGKAFALLFDSFKIEEKFKNSHLPYVVIKDKEEKRITSMLNSAGEIGRQFMNLQTSAVSAVALAKNEDEAALMAL